MKKYIKRNIKVLISFLIGLLIAGTTVYATTVLSGSDVSYSNESSKLTSTNVQGAIDEIFSNIVPIDPNTFKTNKLRTIYASSKGVCINRNGKLLCLKPNNWDVEKDHVQQVFSDISCSIDSSHVLCIASDFYCAVYSLGWVDCRDVSDDSYCNVSPDGSVNCT